MDLVKEMIDWATDFSARPMLWVRGLAGMGKSTITKTIAEACVECGLFVRATLRPEPPRRLN